MEVRQGPLRSRAGSGGPARAHCDQELAGEVWQGSKAAGEGGEGGRKEAGI